MNYFERPNEEAELQESLLEAGLLLYIEPRQLADDPVVDEITGKITSAFRASRDTGNRWRGFHRCSCGACSDNTDYILPSGHKTNSLAIHYVSMHRKEVPSKQLDIIAGFAVEPLEPTREELVRPLVYTPLPQTNRRHNIIYSGGVDELLIGYSLPPEID